MIVRNRGPKVLEIDIWERLRLKVNRAKSAVARPWRRKFLGYSVTANQQLSVFTTYGPPDAGLFTTFPPVRG